MFVKMSTLKPSQLLPPILLAILPLILFWRWLIYGEVLYWGTIMLQFWPWHHLVRESLLQGQWPLWNPLLGNGTPLLANLQSAVFYPPNLIFLFMPTAHALTLSIILHLSLAGLTMYFLARHLQLTSFAATMAALTYMFSGYIVGRTQFVVMVHATAWLPLLLLLSDRLATRRRIVDALWLAVVLAIQLLAGHAQLWFYSLCMTSGYIVFRSWQTGRQITQPTSDHALSLGVQSQSWSSRVSILSRSSLAGARITDLLQTISYLALAVLLALVICAVQILPTAEYLANSPRSDGAERTFALTYSMWPWRLVTLLAPNFFGNPAQDNYWGYANYWEDHAYLGILPFLLALTGIWYSFKEGWQWLRPPQDEISAIPPLEALKIVPFLTVFALISLILAMGWNTPIYLWVFEVVPGFSFFQAPARLLIWYTVAMAILAGVGAQLFESATHNRPHWRRFLAACIALTLAGIAGQWWLAGREITFLVATRNLGILLIIAVVLLLLRPPTSETNSLKGRGWQGATFLFVVFDLLMVAWPLIPLTSASVFSTPIANADELKEQPYRYFADEQFAYRVSFNQYFQFKSFGPADPAHLQELKELLVPNFGVYANLPSANNDDPLVVRPWQTLLNLIEKNEPEVQARLLALLNVDTIISDTPTQPWPVINEANGVTLQAVPNPRPRAYFVNQAIYVNDESEAVDKIIAPEFDPAQEVVIIKFSDVAQPVDQPTVAEVSSARIVAETSNYVQIEVDAPTDGFVILTDTYYPGWQAVVDDQASTVWQANLAFRAVAVEAGSHTIDLIYRPQTFTFGLWTTIVVCLIIGVVMIRLTRQHHIQTSISNLNSS